MNTASPFQLWHGVDLNDIHRGNDHWHSSAVDFDRLDENEWDGHALELVRNPLSPSHIDVTFLEVQRSRWQAGPYASDYTFQSVQGRLLLNCSIIALVQFQPKSDDPLATPREREMAEAQVEEHCIGRLVTPSNDWIWIVPSGDQELCVRIAEAYHCDCEWIALV